MKPDEAMQTAKSIIKVGLGASAGEEPALENAIAEALLWAAKPTTRAMFAARNDSAEGLRILRGAIEGAYDDVQANLISPSLAISRLCALVKYGNPNVEIREDDAEKGGKR